MNSNKEAGANGWFTLALALAGGLVSAMLSWALGEAPLTGTLGVGLGATLATWALCHLQRQQGQAAHADPRPAPEATGHLRHLHQQLGQALQGSEASALQVIERINAIHRGSMEQLARIRCTEANGQELQRIMQEKSLVDSQLCSILQMFVETQEKEVEANLERLQRLQEVKELSAMIEDISHVARQTNFLSINAAIEAARAGEQGRSFAVLAAEIRELSNRVGALSQDIAQRIHKATDGIDEELNRVNAMSDRSTSSNNMRQVIADISAMQDRFQQSMSQLELQRVIADVLAGHEQIEAQIADTLGHVGAQDILRQQIECVQEAMNQVQEDARTARTHALPDYMADQARRFAALTPAVDRPSARTSKATTEGPAIELFG
ncbi:MAG: hypothetical protein RI907_1011 [Pseudomonadota bacterium]|jgi:methyl-accepting chemotaxis protein